MSPSSLIDLRERFGSAPVHDAHQFRIQTETPPNIHIAINKLRAAFPQHFGYISTALWDISGAILR
jgi:hypothetical protein